MHPKNVGTLLAERVLDLETGVGRREVRVLIGIPREIPESTDVYCPYQIVGLLGGTVRYTEGVDAAQAIYLAMEAIGTTLAATPEARSGRLTWYGETALGFPVRAQRPELRLRPRAPCALPAAPGAAARAGRTAPPRRGTRCDPASSVRASTRRAGGDR